MVHRDNTYQYIHVGTKEQNIKSENKEVTIWELKRVQDIKRNDLNVFDCRYLLLHGTV